MKSFFPPSFAFALDGWMQKSNRVTDEEGRLIGFRLADEVQALVEEYGRCNRKLSRQAHTAMVEAGLVSVILEGMQCISWKEGDPNASIIASAFLRLKNLCYTHLTSAGKIAHQLFFLRGQAVESADFLAGTGWELCYSALMREVKAGGAIPRKLPSLCDNIYCPGRPSALKPYQKACAGCHSAVYCSKRCQEADWKLLHKSELSRLLGTERKHVRNAHYTQELRLEHGRWAAFLGYRSHKDQIDSAAEIPYDHVTVLTAWSHEYVPLLDYLQSIGLIDDSHKDNPVYTPQHYLDLRIKELIHYYLSRHDLRLVAAVYPFGHSTVWTLTMFQLATEPPSDIGAYDYVFKCCVAKVKLSRKLVSEYTIADDPV
ncbi:hypothetical protein NMY22_g12211 [Coprinellus aureogranulatus]|nr:hypothetical protein NMY22_g12211 [Coprinellus aureogranulatus]